MVSPHSIAKRAPSKTLDKGSAIASLFQKGLALHQTGDVQGAQRCYEQVIQQDPKHADAMHLLGIAFAQKNAHQQALHWIDQAVAVQPRQAIYHSNKGNILKDTGQLEASVQSYDQAIALKPDFAQAYSNRGNVLKNLQRYDDALASYDRAIALEPTYAQAYANRGDTLFAMGRYEDAVRSCDEAIRCMPSLVEAYINRGVAWRKLGRLQAALADFDHALSVQPQQRDALLNRSVVYKELKHFDAALADVQQVLSIHPDDVHALSNRGGVYQAMDRLQEALVDFDRVIERAPDYAKGYSNRGVVLQKLKRYDAALADFEHAIALNPQLAKAYSNRGVALQELHQWQAAVESFDQAIALDPCDAETFSNRGVGLQAQKQLKQALASFDQAITLDAQHVDAHWNKSLALLLQGDFAQGWPLYEWRMQKAEYPHRSFASPLWLGQTPLQGKTILLHAEQGLGDTIQFCRYAPLLAQQGARVSIEVQAPLKDVMASLDGVHQVWVQGQATPTTDYHCPLLSLPLALHTDANTIPLPTPYLKSDARKRQAWQQRLGASTALRVGLVWSGNTQHQNDLQRSLPLIELLTHLQGPFELVSLQKEVRASDEDALVASKVKHFGDELKDFTDTAALCEAMDVVVSVDTSVAHLAAALGKPTWILLSFIPDWRWQLDRADSPWYESVRLYRQTSARAWAPVLQSVAKDLMQLQAQSAFKGAH